MSYEEQLKQDALELTEETVAAEETVEVEETVADEAEIEAVAEAEAVAEEQEEIAEEALVVCEDTAPLADTELEAIEEITVDEELLDADEESEIEFEIELPAEAPVAESRIGDAVAQAKDTLQSKYDEARAACKSLMQRISGDLEQTNYNPYIRSTTTYKYEILRNSKDTEPVDTFEFQRTSGFSLRAMALTSMLVAATDVAVAKLLKKKK
ncbi:MAG: hypothetical protein E7620_09060 [Ruminococcaceae bacterium]|nr:hypothetical protein [Oscillospiraceae bacterium]